MSSIVDALYKKKCPFYTLASFPTDLGIMYLIWEEQIGGIWYLHKMKIKLPFFGIILRFYQQYDLLFHNTTNNTIYISDHSHYPTENIYITSTTCNIKSLINAIKKENATNHVFFSSTSWGKIMHCPELNTLLLDNIQSISCIEYMISPSFFLSKIKRNEQDIHEELEKEKDIMKQKTWDIFSDTNFQQW
jgi:hypothetical protein